MTHLHAIARASPEEPAMAASLGAFTVERVLERIHLFRCHEVTELLAVLEMLPQYVEQHGGALWKLNLQVEFVVDPELESAWFQPLNL